jgi:hypothetical protein
MKVAVWRDNEGWLWFYFIEATPEDAFWFGYSFSYFEDLQPIPFMIRSKICIEPNLEKLKAYIYECELATVLFDNIIIDYLMGAI